MNCGSLALEVSGEKKLNMWPRDCSCDILVKNVATFCPCLKSLSKDKVKRFILNALTKEVSEKKKNSFVLWLSLKKSIFEQVLQA